MAPCLSLGLQYMLGHDSCGSCYCHAHLPLEGLCLFMLFVFMPHRHVSAFAVLLLACSVECGRCWFGQWGWPSPCGLCTISALPKLVTGVSYCWLPPPLLQQANRLAVVPCGCSSSTNMRAAAAGACLAACTCGAAAACRGDPSVLLWCYLCGCQAPNLVAGMSCGEQQFERGMYNTLSWHGLLAGCVS
jgi:hypothetical protein